MKVRVGLDARDPRIVPDMGARVGFLDDAKPAAQPSAKPGVLVPADAIVQRDGKDVAFVVQGDKAMLRTLTLGRTLGDDREVLSGLEGGEAVVLAPDETLADGARVKLAPAESDSEASNE